MAGRMLVAPDAFKGTLTAPEVAAAVAAGIREAGAKADECPVADGGEGTLEVLLGALGGSRRSAAVQDALGRRVQAAWGMLDDGTALVEAAQASGLALIAAADRDAERASSAGTGELLAAAVRAGARRVIACVGGTASSDGGAGALAALEAAGGLRGVPLTVLCDVTTPFELAAERFAPQKGAGRAAVARLSRRLRALAGELPADPTGVPMTGAGGGLAGGLWALGGELRPGARFVLDAVGFDRRLARADAVVTGEGRLDAQTLEGKIGGVILELARERGVPVHALVGESSIDPAQPAWRGLASVAVAGDPAALRAAGRTLARGPAAATRS